jgi:hypothetical protein
MRIRAVDLSLEELAAMGADAAVAAAQRAHEAGVANIPQVGQVSSFDQNLRAVLATLEESKAALLLSGDRDTAHLLSVAIIELRLKIDRPNDSELKALCDTMLREVEDSQTELLGHRPDIVTDVLTAYTSRVRKLAR